MESEKFYKSNVEKELVVRRVEGTLLDPKLSKLHVLSENRFHEEDCKLTFLLVADVYELNSDYREAHGICHVCGPDICVQWRGVTYRGQQKWGYASHHSLCLPSYKKEVENDKMEETETHPEHPTMLAVSITFLEAQGCCVL